MSELAAWIAALPKAELHIHHGGAFRWETVREVHPEGAKLPQTPPWLDGGRPFLDFDDFREIFLRYLRPATGTPELVARHTREILEDLAAQNVKYTEITVGLAFHMGRGLPMAGVLEALDAGRRAASGLDIECRFLMGLNRHLPLEQVEADLRLALEIGGGVLDGIDLQGDERACPPGDYVPAFRLARQAGWRVRAHAGELCGAGCVRDSVEQLELEHVSHGVRAAEDPELVALLAARGVFLHVCPTSNLRLRVYETYADHPLPALHAAGCKVTLGSDDPLLFGATLADEYRIAVERIGLPPAALVELACNGLEAAALEPSRRSALQAEARRAGW